MNKENNNTRGTQPLSESAEFDTGEPSLPVRHSLRTLFERRWINRGSLKQAGSKDSSKIIRLETKKVRGSSLFDAEFYKSTYPDVLQAGVDTATHYVVHGWRERRNPSALFNTAQYLADYPDVEAAGVNPLLHYLKHGRREGRKFFPADFTPHVESVDLKLDRRKISEEELDAEVSDISASGMFDALFYTLMYGELDLTQDLALRHYCEHGWHEGRNPCEEFDTRFYLETYPDIRASDLNPFWHYVKFGVLEQRCALPDYLARYEEDVRFGNVDPSIQLLAFYTAPDWSRVRAARPAFTGHTCPFAPGEELAYYSAADARIMSRHAEMAKSHGLAGFYFKFDTDDTGSGGTLQTLLTHSEIDIAFCVELELSAEPLVPAALERLVEVMKDPRQIHVEGKPVLLVGAFNAGEGGGQALAALTEALARADIVAPFFIGRFADTQPMIELPVGLDAVIDLPQRWTPAEIAPFRPIERNGVDTVPYSVVAARGVARAHGCARAHVPVYHSVVLARDSSSQENQRRVVYTHWQKDHYRQWLDAAAQSATALHTPDRRFVFVNAWNDWNEGLYLEPDSKGGFNRLNETSRSLLGLHSDTYMPKVTVVVPNYNHSAYLRRRLDSIYGQTYTNMEVVILDDCSTDDSTILIDEYRKKYPGLTRVIVNEKNSGSVFRQWARGIKEATGDLVWIAESDDYCDAHLLQKLVECFTDESVMLAYGISMFVGRDEAPLDISFLSYLEDLGLGDKWRHSYVATAHEEVRSALGIKNSIPNASSAVFRRPPDMPLLDDEAWLSMRVAGDWVFYLHLLRGGKIAFDPSAINFFRRYEGSTAEATYRKDTFYKEVGFASRTVAALYDVPWSVLERCREGFGALYKVMVGSDESQFDRWYDFGAVAQARQHRLPNIMVSTMGFFPGGAEILPIRMANEFKRQGHSVLLFSSKMAPRQDGVRRMLRNDVPLIETADIAAMEDAIAAFGIEALNTHQWHIQKFPLLRPTVFDGLKAHVASLHGMIEHSDAFSVTQEELLKTDRKVTTWVYTADKNLGPFKELGLYQDGLAKFIKMPNGMQPPKITPIRRAEIEIPDDAFVLCCVSRAIPDKGWAETIDAVARARQISQRDIRLILVGNGQVYNEYCRAGVPDFVHLAGFSENSVGYYAAADMGIMLTKFKSESFPLTIVDCLFAGKPYIATSVGEISNMLSTDDAVAGAVFDLVDWEVPVQTAAEIIARFALSPDEYLEAKNRVDEIVLRYRIDVVAEQYVQLFAAERNSERIGRREI
ncbi:MAG: glycoside hydrolase family 99-like domain-containing protein [Burkholderiaceae bacterium]|nr:glycoside hydrolase family 99-like domain-containing protein [Burkholderiaceae bacterium]